MAFINDLSVPSPAGRETASKAANCFLRSVKLGMWAKAHACLSPIGRAGRRIEIPHFAPLKNDTGTVSFAEPRGLKRYWSSFTRAGRGNGRIHRGYQLAESTINENVSRFNVRFKVEIYPSWSVALILINLLVAVIVYMATRKTHAFEYDMLVIRHKSKWWVLTGQAGSIREEDLLRMKDWS